MPNFKWQILSESKEILGYKCQKAQGEFRGRKYIAWFAPSIPISDGPWKFCGLPGLILAVEDMDKYFVFTCIDIKNNQSQPIRFWPTHISRVLAKSYEQSSNACIGNLSSFVSKRSRRE